MVEQKCSEILADILKIEEKVVEATIAADTEVDMQEVLDGPNIPCGKYSNAKANLRIAFRHLEGARMRIGKVMQAIQGGVSILDRPPPTADETVGPD